MAKAMTLEQAIEKAFDRCNLQTGDIDIYGVMYRYKAIRELPDKEFEKVYDTLAERLGLFW